MPEILTPLKSIRAKCLDCCCGMANEVKLCTADKCPLYPYRTGHGPKRPEVHLTEEQIAQRNARLSEFRGKKPH
jgi:hypothetical protein